MADQSDLEKELHERLRQAEVNIPPGREDVTIALYVELRRSLDIVRAWQAAAGQTPATVFHAAPSRIGAND